MCTYAVKKLALLIRYVPGKYRTQQMCDKAIFKKRRNIKFFSWLLQNSTMCDKAVDTRPYTI